MVSQTFENSSKYGYVQQISSSSNQIRVKAMGPSGGGHYG